MIGQYSRSSILRSRRILIRLMNDLEHRPIIITYRDSSLMVIIAFILIFRRSVPQTDAALSMTDPAWKKQCGMLSYYQKLEGFALFFLQIKPVNIYFTI